MPTKPRRVCDNCGKAVGSMCTTCHRQSRAIREKGRPSAHARGYGARWRKLRYIVLHDAPICAVCNRAASTEVDHVIPKVLGGTDQMSNLQGICWQCHADKTANENRTRGGGGRILTG